MPISFRILLIMGVAGTGKTTIGRLIAAELGWPYFEGDDFHPPANIAKMTADHPLNDADRAPWLAAIRASIDACRSSGQSAVFTCSALKERYRVLLGADAPDVLLVHLTGEAALLRDRLAQRQAHYMKPAMLQSQLEALEIPAHALTLGVQLAPTEIVRQILRRLHQP